MSDTDTDDRDNDAKVTTLRKELQDRIDELHKRAWSLGVDTSERHPIERLFHRMWPRTHPKDVVASAMLDASYVLEAIDTEEPDQEDYFVGLNAFAIKIMEISNAFQAEAFPELPEGEQINLAGVMTGVLATLSILRSAAHHLEITEHREDEPV